MSQHRLGDYTLTKDTETREHFIFEFRGFSHTAHIDDMYIALANLNADAAQRAFPKPTTFKSEADEANEKAAKRLQNIADGLLRKKNAEKQKNEV